MILRTVKEKESYNTFCKKGEKTPILLIACILQKLLNQLHYLFLLIVNQL